MVTTAKTQMISGGRIVIPDDWANFSNRDRYELHDEIIAMTCRKYNTKLIRTYNLTKVWD